jgi:hypothetical protein
MTAVLGEFLLHFEWEDSGVVNELVGVPFRIVSRSSIEDSCLWRQLLLISQTGAPLRTSVSGDRCYSIV